MKTAICTIAGITGSLVASLFGGWTTSLTTLLIFMGIDYVTGMIVAGVFHHSPKSETGALESRAGFKGLCKKGMILLLVLVAHRLDMATGSNYIRDALCIAFIVNEAISIVENAVLMDLPIPKILTKGIEMLKEKTMEGDEDESERFSS